MNQMTCRKCLSEKKETHFYIRADNLKRATACKDCLKTLQRKYREDVPNYQRKRKLQKYGMTVETYQLLFESQNGNCAMCSRKSERSLSVDHDHVTGKVRALLCVSCNALLGFAQEDLMVLEAAIKYLKTHERTNA